jgi:hypothetical protein
MFPTFSGVLQSAAATFAEPSNTYRELHATCGDIDQQILPRTGEADM